MSKRIIHDWDYDFLNWCRYNLKIVTMDARLVSLDFNEAQLKVHNTLELQEDAGLPVRGLILKARREGISTYVEASNFWKINAYPMRTATVCSADTDSTNKIFRMVKIFQDNLPRLVGRPTEYSNRKEITYSSPHMSSILCQTAGKDVLGRGGLNHYLHCSEVAFWGNAETQLGGAMQEVPDDANTSIILESTANGVGGAFYDMFMQALEDRKRFKRIDGFLPIFLPWFIFRKYWMACEEGFEIGKDLTGRTPDEWLLPEEELVNVFQCVPEQLQWRRWMIRNKCQGDLSLFKQEYPATVLEAFQSSGRPVFSQTELNYQESFSSDAGEYGVFIGSDPAEFNKVSKTLDCWHIKSKPSLDHQYTMGIDTMTGKLSDTTDENSKQDRHGVAVYDRNTNEFVAVFKGQMNQAELGKQCLAAATYYNNAWVAPEIPGAMEVLRIFREAGYENIWQRPAHTEKYVVDESDLLGWKTTTITRPWLVETFKISLASTGLKLRFEEIISEMRTFIYDKTGKPIHSAGRHDDVLFGAMIALHVHTNSPLRVMPYKYEYAGEEEEKRSRFTLNSANCIDDFDPENDFIEEELWQTTE